MIKTAEVISVNGRLATVKADRSSMCDACHKSSCGGGCSMGGIMGSSAAVTAVALNPVGAEAGDTVELESSDKRILLYAFAVFLLPILIAFGIYTLITLLAIDKAVAAITAVLGFVMTYVGVGIYARSKKGKETDIVIVRVTKKNERTS